MIYSTATVEVNPPGEPPLSRDQLWEALVLKARDARQFLPPGVCTKCVVSREGADHIIREATIYGDDLVEFVTFKSRSKLSFHQAQSPREGVIVNEIIERRPGELQLRFYAYLGLPNVEPGGPEEKAEQARLDSAQSGYPAALRATLARARQLVAQGLL